MVRSSRSRFSSHSSGDSRSQRIYFVRFVDPLKDRTHFQCRPSGKRNISIAVLALIFLRESGGFASRSKPALRDSARGPCRQPRRSRCRAVFASRQSLGAAAATSGCDRRPSHGRCIQHARRAIRPRRPGYVRNLFIPSRAASRPQELGSSLQSRDRPDEARRSQARGGRAARRDCREA